VGVAEILRELTDLNSIKWKSHDSPEVIGLLHDVCKIGFYSVSMRNAKNERTGQWERVPYYTVDDAYPIGHGEKSVIMLLKHISLTNEEIVCIRWHMGAYEPKDNYMALGKAKELYPNLLWVHMADEMEAVRADNATAKRKVC
jgi:hypothetical protein